MIKIIEKATFKFEKVLLVDLLDEYIKYDGLVDDPKGWGNIYDSVALPRFKDYCLAMLSEMEE